MDSASQAEGLPLVVLMLEGAPSALAMPGQGGGSWYNTGSQYTGGDEKGMSIVSDCLHI